MFISKSLWCCYTHIRNTLPSFSIYFNWRFFLFCEFSVFYKKKPCSAYKWHRSYMAVLFAQTIKGLNYQRKTNWRKKFIVKFLCKTRRFFEIFNVCYDYAEFSEKIVFQIIRKWLTIGKWYGFCFYTKSKKLENRANSL